MVNDFEPLQEWNKSFNVHQRLLETEFFKGLRACIRRSKAKKEESTCSDYIQKRYNECVESGEYISESDGQFTGGYIVLVYRYLGSIFEFGYKDGKWVDLNIFTENNFD